MAKTACYYQQAMQAILAIQKLISMTKLLYQVTMMLCWACLATGFLSRRDDDPT